MDWNDYLIIAEEVYSGRSSIASEEACCRSAISRAYFAAYNIADIRLRTKEKGNKPFAIGSHKNLIEYYKTHQDIKRKKIGVEIDRLKDLREFCDYEYLRGRVSISNFPAQTANALQDTKTLLGLISVLKPH